MKKALLIFSFLGMFSAFSFGQLIDEKNVTVTMDLQPILQLNMSTPDQVDFIFDNIPSYYGGIIKYGATVLKVSSSVSWDLYAVGTSQNGTSWDQQMTYSGNNTGAIDALPLSALELRQFNANAYGTGLVASPWGDYSVSFAPKEALVQGQNSIYYSNDPYTAPVSTEKYIQGTQGALAADGAPGGSYLETSFAGGPPAASDYYFTIDYRILPGLPAIFPAAGTNAGVGEDLITTNGAGSYAQPGVYSMDVKYILLENQ